MGWLRKKVKQIGKGIKKIGKKIGKAFKKIIKPFAKVFGKLGPLGSMAMMFILPGIGQMMAGWGASLSAGTSFLGTSLGAVGNFAGHAIKFVGNAINFVATAPQKIFKTITGAISNGWNALLGRDPTGLNVSGMLETMDPSVVSEIVKESGASTSWFGNFKADMQSAWTSGGAVDTLGNIGGVKGEIVGEGNWFDYSQQGQAKLGSFGSDFKQMKTDIADVFKKDPRKAMTEATAESTFGKTSTEFANFMKDGGNTDYVLDRTGVLGNIRDFVGGTGSKIADITVPGVGDLGDVGWGATTAVSTYSTLGQLGIVGPDGEQGGGAGDTGYLANQQLYGGDTGGVYDRTKVDAWDYNPNIGAAQNYTDIRSIYNQSMGFPQDFDPWNSPFYGEGFGNVLQQKAVA